MPQTETWTVGRLLQWTTDHFKKRGFETPRLDAEVLLAEARGCQRIELYTAFDQVPSDETLTAFRELVRRRAEGTPVAYLVGHKEFYSLSFRVTPDVLIPRPETEFLVIALLDLLKPRGHDQPAVIADLGTGSGILAVTLAKHLPAARVTAVDISPAALEVAGANARQHGVSDRVDLLQSDLFTAVPQDRHYDFVVSNPPYVASAEYEQLSPQVRNYEPRGALVAGPRGTEVIERIVPAAAGRLVPGGYLLVEISPMLDLAVQEIVAAEPSLDALPTVKDLANQPRVARARKKA
jgi:release factor glutamine methyltransferase